MAPAESDRRSLLSHIGLGQRLVQLDARVDAEFGEDLAKVVFDGPWADEQSRADLGVRQGFPGQFGDLGFLAVSLLVASTERLRAVSPVATSSRRARSANPSAPMAVNIWWAVRSWWRASERRCWRRSHSP